jgi:hypothetical protein
LKGEGGLAKRAIFTVASPLGYQVTLSRDRWRQIIRFKHPALAGCEKEVRFCLQLPLLIRESAKEAQVHLHYNEHNGKFLCVVTAPSGSDDHFVVTAYFTKTVKGGKELWKR